MSLPVDAYERAAVIVPSDSTVVDCEGFYVGGAGNVTAILKRDGPSGTPVVFTGVTVGSVYRIACSKIMAATTATLLVALY